MKNLAVQTENEKGNSINYKDNYGCITTFVNHIEDFIKVDNFEGLGEGFKKRELSEISIVQNGEILFKGDKYKLFEILKINKYNYEKI